MKRKHLSVLLALMMVISAVGGTTATSHAALIDGTATLTITPNVTEIAVQPGSVDVIYTLKITPPEGKHIGVFSFNLVAPEGMILATNSVTSRGGDGYWKNSAELEYHEEFRPDGIFGDFNYTPASGYFEALGTLFPRVLTEEAVFMTIKATIDNANAVGNYALVVTGENVGPDGDGTFTFHVDSRPVTIVDAINGVQDVAIAVPAKGGTPQATVSGTGYTGAVTWSPIDGTFAANTTYTANVVLTAATGYKFDSGATGKVNGNTASGNTVSPDGSTLSFSYTFSATADKDMPTCLAPTGLTAGYGDLLNSVSLTNSSGNTDGVWAWEDGSQAVGNAGLNTFKATFTPVDTATYQTVSNIDVGVTVSPKSISDVVISPISDQGYTGSEIKPVITVTGDSGKTLVEDVDYTVSYSNNINVGTASATVQAIADGNYTFSELSKNFDIVAQAGSISVSGDLNKVYDGLQVNPAGLAVNKNGSTGALTYTYYTNPEGTVGETTTAPKDAGAYSLRVSMAADSNFGAAVSDPFVFNVSKATLTVTADNKSIIYGDPAPAYTVSYGAFQGGEDSNVLNTSSLSIACSYAQGNDADNYTIVPSGVIADNYDITFVAGTLTVSPKSLDNSMMASLTDLPYTGSYYTPVPAITDGSYTLVEDVDFTYSYLNYKDAGTATVMATGKGNYTGTATGTFTISPAGYSYSVDGTQDVAVGSGISAITVATSAKKGVGAGGEPVVGTLAWYSDSSRTIQAIDADLSEKNVGEKVTLYWEFTTTNTNYEPATTTGETEFTIVDGVSQDLVFGTAGNISKTYGDDKFINVATNNSLDGGGISYASSDTSVATVDASGEVTILKAGTTNITATAAAITGIYATTSISYTLIVGKANITIQAMDKSVYVNSEVPDLTAPAAGKDYKVTGLVGSDVLASEPVLSYASSPDISSPGTVAIKAGSAVVPEGGNYDATIIYVDGTLTIRAKSSSGGGAVQTYYTLSFNTNGGSAVNSVSKVSGATVGLSGYKPVRDGYIFDGWYSDSGLLNSISSVTLDENVTVYAKWTEAEEVEDELFFIDVNADDWFYGAVKYVNEKGLMSGTSKTMFSPKMATTRGMIVAILHRLEGSPKADLGGLFGDVSINQYYAEAIAWAAEKKIVSGYSDSQFGPDDFITREQMAVILMNYARFMGYDVSATADISGFADSGKVSAWAGDAMSWANAEAFIQGSGENLMPDGKAERAQVAAILQRFIEKNSK